MNLSGTILNSAAIRRVLCGMSAVAAWGCSGPVPSKPGGPTVAVPAVSYDGHYEGTVTVAAVSYGTDPQTCAVASQLALDVRNNAFVYVQPHPKIAGTAPGLTADKTTVTYDGSIAPDGTITGNSRNFNGTMAGHVASTHMTGQISGVLCSYTFTAERV